MVDIRRFEGKKGMAQETDPVKLRAFDLEDLSVLSGLVQDALAPATDMIYLPNEQCFAIALNRFKWEGSESGPPYERTHAGLRFDKVIRVARRNMPNADRERILSLLAISYHEGVVVLTFSGEAAIRLEVESLHVCLQDLGDPWPTQWLPEHDPGTAD